MGKGRGREAIEEPMGQESVRDEGGLDGGGGRGGGKKWLSLGSLLKVESIGLAQTLIGLEGGVMRKERHEGQEGFGQGLWEDDGTI